MKMQPNTNKIYQPVFIKRRRIMLNLGKKTAMPPKIQAKDKEIEILNQYQASSRKERDDLWMQYPDFRELFDEIDEAEVFLTSWSDVGFSVHRFGRKQNGFVEYQTLF